MSLTKVGLSLGHFLARVALLVSALQLASSGWASSAVWAAAAAAGYFVLRSVTALVRARAEIDLSSRLLERILRSDLFGEPLRTRQDVVASGLHDAARLETTIVPGLVGDLCAAAVVCLVAWSRGERLRLIAFLVGLACGALAVVALRKFAWRASGRAWETKQAHTRRILDGLEGAPELVTAGAARRYQDRVVRGLDELRRASWVLSVDTLVMGRLPILAGVGVAILAASRVTEASLPTRATEWALLGAMLPPFAGLAAAIAAVIELRAPVAAVRGMLSRPERANGTLVANDLVPLALEEVHVVYGHEPAIRGVSISFDRGITALVGSNGSGKSTVLRAIAGLVTPKHGRVVIGGVSGTRLRWEDVRSRMAFLPQRPYLPVGETVGAAIRFLFEASEAACRAELERVSIWNTLVEKGGGAPLDVPVDELSAGERQRVAVARLLLCEAELYLLDEPDANLDRAGVDRLIAILEELSRRAIVIVAAHTPDLVALADHVIELDKGRVVRDARDVG